MPIYCKEIASPMYIFFKCFRCDDFYFELFEIEYTCLATSFLSYVLSIKEKQEEPLGRVTMVIDFGREH